MISPLVALFIVPICCLLCRSLVSAIQTLFFYIVSFTMTTVAHGGIDGSVVLCNDMDTNIYMYIIIYVLERMMLYAVSPFIQSPL